MDKIMSRPKKDGSLSDTATIRKKKGGEVILSLNETFSTEKAAGRWITERRQFALNKSEPSELAR